MVWHVTAKRLKDESRMSPVTVMPCASLGLPDSAAQKLYFDCLIVLPFMLYKIFLILPEGLCLA